MVAAMLLTSVFGGTVVAKQPAFTGSAPSTPNLVSAGKVVRFDVTWTNTSTSNLPTVNTKAVTPGGATFLGLAAGPSQGTCATQTATLLQCAFGTVRSGGSVTFSPLYRVPASGGNFSVTFVFTAQGSSPNDQPGSSRGDDMPISASVNLASASSNDGGSYIVGDDTIVQNNQALNKRNNPQSAKLDFSASTDDNFGATVSEAATTKCAPGKTTCFGDLVIMKVKNGAAVGGGFLVTVAYTSAPAQPNGFVHWLNDGATGTVEGVDFELITQSCDDTAAGENCIADTFKTGANTFFVLHMFENGPMRGF